LNFISKVSFWTLRALDLLPVIEAIWPHFEMSPPSRAGTKYKDWEKEELGQWLGTCR
jgi:hypothetical protein